MKIQAIDLEQQHQLVELFKTDSESKTIEYYMDRGSSFFGLYFWAKPQECIVYGAYEGSELVGMTSLIPLPIKFHQGKYPVFLNTDFFVHHKYRKGLAAGKLLQQLQVKAPYDNMIEIGVENQPQFLDKLKQVCEKYNHSFLWAKPTTLIQNIVLSRSAHQDLNVRVYSSKEEVESYWREKKACFYKSLNWQFDEKFDLSLSKGLSVFKISDGKNIFSGIFFDRSEYQKIRWNGMPKVAIERYRRRLNNEGIKLNINDELKYLNLSFCDSTTDDLKFIMSAMIAVNNYAFEHNYFCWNIRDFKYPIVKNNYFESVSYTRRISVVTNISKEGQYDKHLFATENNLLESIFL